MNIKDYTLSEMPNTIDVYYALNSKSSCPVDLLTLDAKPKSYWSEVLDKDRFGMLRNSYVENVGFPILTSETLKQLEKICKNSRVVDVCCGTGFISKNLIACGLEIDAIDSLDHIYFAAGWRQASHVRQQYAEDLNYEDYDTFILSWPNYESDIGLKVINSIPSGKTLIYQGESKGGCTGNNEMFHALKHNFMLRSVETNALNENHIRWPGIRDSWHVYTKL